MRLDLLSTQGFRNLVDAQTCLSPATTVLLGDNGQGKTSFLEAIGVLATTKSFRGASPDEMARDGSSCGVEGLVEGRGGKVRLQVTRREGQRQTRLDGATAELGDYIEHLTVVPITQDHAGIVRGGPQHRRDFLDRGILGVRPSYLRTLSRYRRALRQKNALLRREGSSPSGGTRVQLAAWNEKLARDGAEVVAWRRDYVRELASVLAELAQVFLPEAEPLRLELRDVLARSEEPMSETMDTGALRTAAAAALMERMGSLVSRELAAGQALCGPHRDDLSISLGGRDARRFASSGQQRNALLALKLAKTEVFRRRRSETPILLVDDVDTEIDATRLARFLAHVGGRAQAVLTSSKRDLFRQPQQDVLFLEVARGALTPHPC